MAKKEYRAIKATHPFHSVQIDLADFQRLKAFQKKEIAYLLIILDIYTRYMWIIPLQTKHKKEMGEAFEEWIKDMYLKFKKKLENLTSDQEFDNKVFNDLAQRYGYRQWFADKGEKNRTGVVERSIRSVRRLIALHMSNNNTAEYVSALPRILREYNHRIHSAHNQKPYDILHGNNNPEWAPDKFVWDIRNGSRVRIRLNRRKFAKSNEPYWSAEVYEVVDREKFRYRLRDSDGNILDKLYAVHQLMVVKPGTKNLKQEYIKQIERQAQKDKIVKKLRKEGVKPDEDIIKKGLSSRKEPPDARKTATSSRKKPPKPRKRSKEPPKPKKRRKAPKPKPTKEPPKLGLRRSTRNRKSKYKSLAGMT